MRVRSSVRSLVVLFLAACGHDARAVPDAAIAVDAPVDAAPAPGLRLFDYAIAVDVSPDGRQALFEDLGTDTVTAVIHDTVADTVARVVDVGDPATSLVTGLAANGRISVFHGSPVTAALWDRDHWIELGSPSATGCGGDVASAFDVSADGHVAIGLAWNGCAAAAMWWSDASGTAAFTPLAVLGESDTTAAPTNRATAISDDGAVAGGFASGIGRDRMPAAWYADGHGVLLDDTGSTDPGEVLSIDGHGKVMAGILGADGFVWEAGTGLVRMRRFDLALPTDPVFPNAMTADGTHVFGGVGDAFFSTPIAFVWTAPDGMRALADVAAAAGVAIPTGTILNNVLGSSADGTVLVGTALDAGGAAKTFTLRLPPSVWGPP